MSPQVANLLQVYAYHRHKQLNVPMSEDQAAQTTQVVDSLSLTLKTILKI